MQKAETDICKNRILFSGDQGSLPRKVSFVRSFKEWS